MPSKENETASTALTSEKERLEILEKKVHIQKRRVEIRKEKLEIERTELRRRMAPGRTLGKRLSIHVFGGLIY